MKLTIWVSVGKYGGGICWRCAIGQGEGIGTWGEISQ